MLRAVGDGRAMVTCSREPDLYVDGLCVCDQFTAHRLSRLALIRPTARATVGTRVPAELTTNGARALAGDLR